MDSFVITKKIAKHGSNSIVVIPKVLQNHLKPKTVVKVTFEILQDPEEDGAGPTI